MQRRVAQYQQATGVMSTQNKGSLKSVSWVHSRCLLPVTGILSRFIRELRIRAKLVDGSVGGRRMTYLALRCLYRRSMTDPFLLPSGATLGAQPQDISHLCKQSCHGNLTARLWRSTSSGRWQDQRHLRWKRSLESRSRAVIEIESRDLFCRLKFCPKASGLILDFENLSEKRENIYPSRWSCTCWSAASAGCSHRVSLLRSSHLPSGQMLRRITKNAMKFKWNLESRREYPSRRNSIVTWLSSFRKGICA